MRVTVAERLRYLNAGGEFVAYVGPCDAAKGSRVRIGSGICGPERLELIGALANCREIFCQTQLPVHRPEMRRDPSQVAAFGLNVVMQRLEHPAHGARRGCS